MQKFDGENAGTLPVRRLRKTREGNNNTDLRKTGCLSEWLMKVAQDPVQ
jgi:hypothetical protein